jgi:hypothetical protein
MSGYALLLSVLAPAEVLPAMAAFLEFIPGVPAPWRMADKDCNEWRAGRDLPFAVVTPKGFLLFVRERG